MAKIALITFGNEESYGLSFVGGELLKYGQEIKYFEGDRLEVEPVADWSPDYVMFSPLTVFFNAAKSFAQLIKKLTPDIKTVFGGHHILSNDVIGDDIDIAVRGPVRGSIERILGGKTGLIETIPTSPEDLSIPARLEYFRDIPRIAKRYRKFVLSMLGCPWNCSYCSSSSGHITEVFGCESLRRYYLKRRPLEYVLDEIAEIMTFPTQEIEWVDDDALCGDEDWMLEFIPKFAKFHVPMYISTCSVSVLKASDRLLETLRQCVNVAGMGIQAIRPSSLRLFNRQWDSEEKMQEAYDRLLSFGYKVNLQAIIGLPVDDPLEDAIEMVKGLQRIGAGSICSVYPLMVYPGTELAKKGFELNPDCSGDTNSGVVNIRFDEEITKQLKNLCKLATFFVKYNIDESLMRTLLKIDYDDDTSASLSMLRYKECVIDRLGDKGRKIFEDIISSMKLRF